MNLAFSVAIAAAASGNMALIVDGSSPEWRFTDPMVDVRTNEFRAESTLSLLMASLSRVDMGSDVLCVSRPASTDRRGEGEHRKAGYLNR